MKALALSLALLPIALLGGGCKKSPSLLGKWSVSVKEMTGTFEFQKDDKMVLAVTTPGGVINMLGECKLKGEEATLTFSDVQVPGQSDANGKLIKDALKNELNKPQIFRVIFVSDDEVAFTEKPKVAPKPAAPPAGTTPAGTTPPAGATPAAAAKAVPAGPAPAAMTLKRVKEQAKEGA